MQDMVDGDNNRKPVKFQGVAVYLFVGDIGNAVIHPPGGGWQNPLRN